METMWSEAGSQSITESKFCDCQEGRSEEVKLYIKKCIEFPAANLQWKEKKMNLHLSTQMKVMGDSIGGRKTADLSEKKSQTCSGIQAESYKARKLTMQFSQEIWEVEGGSKIGRKIN